MQSCDYLAVHFGNAVGGQDDNQGLTHAMLQPFNICVQLCGYLAVHFDDAIGNQDDYQSLAYTLQPFYIHDAVV
jgi:hypothetical protein